MDTRASGRERVMSEWVRTCDERVGANVWDYVRAHVHYARGRSDSYFIFFSASSRVWHL
jgi:hypothetical protein